jgi:FolB domain-containing protein
MIVKIKNFRCKATLGFFDWEKKNKRNILLNIAYGLSDSQKTIQQTLDYDVLAQKINHFLDKNSFDLCENLAYSLSDYLSKEKNIEWVELECIKPNALENAEQVSVVCRK